MCCKFKEVMKQGLNLTNRMDCRLDCYQLAKRRFIIFNENKINHNDISAVLESVSDNCSDERFGEWKTFIVLAETDEVFEKSELFYSDNVNTFVVFYLINLSQKKAFTNDQWIFALGCNFKKHIHKIDDIVRLENII